MNCSSRLAENWLVLSPRGPLSGLTRSRVDGTWEAYPQGACHWQDPTVSLVRRARRAASPAKQQPLRLKWNVARRSIESAHRFVVETPVTKADVFEL